MNSILLRCRRGLSALSLPLLGAFLIAPPAFAQSGAGVIAGRVLNPATTEYVRNAQVRVDGTALSVTTESDGSYTLFNVPAGEVTVVVSYTGYRTERAAVMVTAGETTRRDFEITNLAATSDDGTVLLSEFTVNSEREGNSKAIMEQKSAMNVKTVVAADNFGDIAEGNVGEFLKFMPGIVLDYVETDTRAARMGGMDAFYGAVTLDGNSMASGGSGGFGSGSRQFEFEAFSINNIETIEVNKTLSADMPGDAPAGTVNLRTKSALDRKRPVFNYTVGFIGNQYEHSFSRTPRHDDERHAKSRPTGTFDYSSGPLLGGKLGFQINGAFSNVFKEQFRHSLSYNYTSAQALAIGEPVITGINFKDGPKITEKSSGGAKIDFEPFQGLRFSVTGSYTYFDDVFANRNLNFVVNTAQIAPGSGPLKVIALPTTNANTRIDQSGTTDDKRKYTTNMSGNFSLKRGRLNVDGVINYSKVRESRGPQLINTVGTANVRLTRMGWTAERDSLGSPAWQFTQTSGPDWYDMASYGRSDTQTNNIGRNLSFGYAEEITGKLDFKYTVPWDPPTFYKFGVSERASTWDRRQIYSFTSTYVGPGNNQLTAVMPQSVADFRTSPWGTNLGGLPVPDKEALSTLTYTHPEYFVESLANQISAFENVLGSPQKAEEYIDGLYLLQNTKVGRWQFEGGLRYENTWTRSETMSELPAAENPFATINSSGVKVATTTGPNALNYAITKWSRPPVVAFGGYDHWLPSASARWNISDSMNLKLGYNKAVRRPRLDRIAGRWTFETNVDGDLTATIPNPDLQPERSEKVSAIWEYYFEPAGTFSVHVFQTSIKGAVDDDGALPVHDFIATNSVYGSHPLVQQLGALQDAGIVPEVFVESFSNNPGVRKIKGIELNYSQQLTFLPGEVLRGLNVFATYSRYNSSPRPNNFVPQNATAGLNWRYKKMNARISGTWTDDIYTGGNTVPGNSPYFPGDREILKERMIFDVGAGYKFAKWAEVYIAGRNAFNSGKTWQFVSDDRIRQMERYGGQWTVGLKGTF